MKKILRKIENNSKNLENCLDRPLMRIGLRYINGNPPLIPTHLYIGYLTKGVKDSLWLLDSVYLKRVSTCFFNKDLPVYKILGSEYQFKEDLWQVPITYTGNENLYAFYSDSDAEKILDNLRKGSKAIVLNK